jgi:hypothetical protein
VSAACVRAALSLALEHCSLVVAVSALMLALLGLLSMARVKTELFCSIKNDERSGLPDEMPGGLHTHPGHNDLILGVENERLSCHDALAFAASSTGEKRERECSGTGAQTSLVKEMHYFFSIYHLFRSMTNRLNTLLIERNSSVWPASHREVL